MSEETVAAISGTAGQDLEVAEPSKLPPHPLVSVCMITYNHAPYVRQALDSVLMQQTDFPYEICLGEDQSTDGTREICREYAARYPDKIRLFLRDRTNPQRQQYRVPYAHNGQATYLACRGKYVAFLEGDDYWICPTKLSRQVDVLESNPGLTMAAHYHLLVPENRPWEAYPVPTQPMRDFSIEDLLRVRFWVHASSLLLRRFADMDWDILRHTPCGDIPRLFCQLLRGKGLILPDIMSVYRVHEGGVFSGTSDIARIRQTLELWEVLQAYVPAPLRPLHQVAYARILADAVGRYRRAGLRKEAARHCRQALRVVRAMGTCSRSERLFCAAAALDSLLFPRLRRIRQQLVRAYRGIE